MPYVPDECFSNILLLGLDLDQNVELIEDVFDFFEKVALRIDVQKRVLNSFVKFICRR